MTINPLSDHKIVDSWNKNVSPWTTAVRGQQIESRKLITDQAIVDAVLTCFANTVIDLGCGEGWLTRKLTSHGLAVTGIDAVAGLVEQAKREGGGAYRQISYEDIIEGKLHATVDAIVCNFSLIGKESVEGLFDIFPTLLNPNGKLIIQTLHPVMACGDDHYVDGWREGSWDGFNNEFTDPAPWYFRTLESWVNLFNNSDLQLQEMREPLHPITGKPASVIFTGGLLKS